MVKFWKTIPEVEKKNLKTNAFPLRKKNKRNNYDDGFY